MHNLIIVFKFWYTLFKLSDFKLIMNSFVCVVFNDYGSIKWNF